MRVRQAVCTGASRVRDVATIIYTSGTTANPKAACCRMKPSREGRWSVRAAVRQPARTMSTGARAAVSHRIAGSHDRRAGAGCTYVTDTHFDPVRAGSTDGSRAGDDDLAVVSRRSCRGLLEQPDFNPQQLARLKSIVMIGSRALAETVQSRFPETELLQACGMTETAGIFALAEPSDSLGRTCDRAGKALSGLEIRIANLETRLDAAVGELEKSWFAHCVMEGY